MTDGIYEARRGMIRGQAETVRAVEAPVKEQGTKYDQDKPALALIPTEGIIEVGRAMTYGQKKYSTHNWRKGLGHLRLASAALRHLFAWIGGKDVDEESGLSHLAHAGACIMMLIQEAKERKDLDDRYEIANLGDEKALEKLKK